MSDSIDGGPPQDGRGPNKWPDLGSDALCEAPRRYTLLKGKRNLVTGADGFIGAHLTEALVGKGLASLPCASTTHSIIGDGLRTWCPFPKSK